MPKFIGRREHSANRHFSEAPKDKKIVCLSYAQKTKLPQDQVYYRLDTSDRGGPKTLAKRWNRWYATAETILACPDSTEKMRLAAS
jgi:hypothetical protein